MTDRLCVYFIKLYQNTKITTNSSHCVLFCWLLDEQTSHLHIKKKFIFDFRWNFKFSLWWKLLFFDSDETGEEVVVVYGWRRTLWTHKGLMSLRSLWTLEGLSGPSGPSRTRGPSWGVTLYICRITFYKMCWSSCETLTRFFCSK